VLLLELRTGKDESNIGGTHLNICAILSQLGDHSKALKHAKKAVVYFSNSTDEGINAITMKIVAFHNTGVELEHLGDFEECVEIYAYGYSLAKKYLGLKHKMTSNLNT
jgi:tetratricopeptide (TPR) repeat protein